MLKTHTTTETTVSVYYINKLQQDQHPQLLDAANILTYLAYAWYLYFNDNTRNLFTGPIKATPQYPMGYQSWKRSFNPHHNQLTIEPMSITTIEHLDWVYNGYALMDTPTLITTVKGTWMYQQSQSTIRETLHNNNGHPHFNQWEHYPTLPDETIYKEFRKLARALLTT